MLTTDEILAPSPSLGIRVDRFEFDILDKNLIVTSQVHPITDCSITAGVDRTIARTLDGLVLTFDDAIAIDPLTDRIRPVMVLQNGERFPLGIYLFGDHRRSVSTRPDTWEPNCYDQGLILQDKTERSTSLPTKAPIKNLMVSILNGVGITQIDLAAGDVNVGEPLAWPAGTERSRILNDCAAAMGCLTPFFDNVGVYRCVEAPDPERAVPDFKYGPGRIIADSIVESDDSYSAPNRYIAIGDGTDTPVVGTYDIPASAPHSAANRGYIVSETLDVPGVANTQAAIGAARAAYLKDKRTWRRLSFVSPLDPRHDMYAIVEYSGMSPGVYLETGYRMQLKAGGEHQHDLNHLWPVEP